MTYQDFAPGQIIFVYNANAGIVSALRDAVHKTVSPETYPCSLCALTYGAVSMRREWREFLRSMRPQPVFLYRDQLKGPLAEFTAPFMAVVLDDSVQELLSATDLNQIEDLNTLMSVVRHRLSYQE